MPTRRRRCATAVSPTTARGAPASVAGDRDPTVQTAAPRRVGGDQEHYPLRRPLPRRQPISDIDVMAKIQAAPTLPWTGRRWRPAWSPSATRGSTPQPLARPRTGRSRSSMSGACATRCRTIPAPKTVEFADRWPRTRLPPSSRRAEDTVSVRPHQLGETEPVIDRGRPSGPTTKDDWSTATPYDISAIDRRAAVLLALHAVQLGADELGPQLRGHRDRHRRAAARRPLGGGGRHRRRPALAAVPAVTRKRQGVARVPGPSRQELVASSWPERVVSPRGVR